MTIDDLKVVPEQTGSDAGLPEDKPTEGVDPTKINIAKDARNRVVFSVRTLDVPLIKEAQREWGVVDADPPPEVPADHGGDEDSDLDGDLFHASYMQGSGIAGAAPPGGAPTGAGFNDDDADLYDD